MNVILKNLWWLVGVISMLVIFIIRFTPLRIKICCSVEFAESLNNVIETLAFSLLAASLFYAMNDIVPNLHKNKVIKAHIKNEIGKIKRSLRLIVDRIEPFRIDDEKYTFDSFTITFENKDLNDTFMGGDQTFLEYINQHKFRIEKICRALLENYENYMSSKQLDYVDIILNSFFIRYSIIPMNFAVPEEWRYNYPNNQKTMGESIFKLYSM